MKRNIAALVIVTSWALLVPGTEFFHSGFSQGLDILNARGAWSGLLVAEFFGLALFECYLILKNRRSVGNTD